MTRQSVVAIYHDGQQVWSGSAEGFAELHGIDVKDIDPYMLPGTVAFVGEDGPTTVKRTVSYQTWGD